MNKRAFLRALSRELRGLPRGERAASLDYYGEMIQDRMEEGLSIRVDGDELHALHAERDHAVHGVAAAAAHTDDLDFCELVEYVII